MVSSTHIFTQYQQAGGGYQSTDFPLNINAGSKVIQRHQVIRDLSMISSLICHSNVKQVLPKFIWEEPRCHPSWQKMDSSAACASPLQMSPSLSRRYTTSTSQRRTQDDGIYRASIALRNKNAWPPLMQTTDSPISCATSCAMSTGDESSGQCPLVWPDIQLRVRHIHNAVPVSHNAEPTHCKVAAMHDIVLTSS